ncbi:LytTR family transcriptional regulator [Flavivirga eckloniae]|uniref:LytTR family transcriptional regulator n=2 Tax=Flavivirga eckloniae TaxID=1803846 RepID=A0A2K9PUX8_9FLAO|nr:LytTR family transcriptional regulator [Flavivirga eckloniae]
MPKKTSYTSNLKNKITHFLLQPYPFYYKGKSLKIIVALFFFMTFFFNFAFKPFNVEYSEHKMNYFWISIIHALTPPIVIYSIAFILGKLKKEDNWNILKEILFIFFIFFIIGLVQFLIRDIIYDNLNNWSWQYLFEEITNTFLVGTLFVVILIPINFNLLNSKHINNATILNNFINEKITLVKLKTDIVNIEGFEFDINQFIYAKSEGNYIEIYFDKEKPKKKLIRTTLKSLDALLKTYPNIIKTHRSYLINCNYVNKINGNAQGYQLQINESVVPVSRNMIKIFNKTMKNIS